MTYIVKSAPSGFAGYVVREVTKVTPNCAQKLLKTTKKICVSAKMKFSSKIALLEKTLADLRKAKVQCQVAAEAAMQATQKQADEIMNIVQSAVGETHQMINKKTSNEISEIEENEVAGGIYQLVRHTPADRSLAGK